METHENVPAVLVMYGSGGQQTQVSVAGRTTGEQEAKMAELAGQAARAWRRGGHPGWSVDTLDSQYLLQLDQPQVGGNVTLLAVCPCVCLSLSVC